MSDRPRIVVTMHGPEQAAREEPTWASFEPYLAAVRRAGGDPISLDPTASPAERAEALAAMDGLLLPGGVDLDPALYGKDAHPTVVVEGARDDLELAAWDAARERAVPIFGVCRGFQAINVFSGGTLAQHVEGHDSPTADPMPHPLQLDPTSRLAMILGETGPLASTRGEQLPPPGGAARRSRAGPRCLGSRSPRRRQSRGGARVRRSR